MRSITITVAVILALLATSVAADVVNLDLSAVGATGVAGRSTTIYGTVGGSTPYTNIEINIKMAQPPPSGMTYQGWAIDSKSNATASIGAFVNDSLNSRYTAAGSMSQNPYDTLAVSLEPTKSKSTTPTTIVARGAWASGDSNVSASDFVKSSIFPVDECFQRQLVMQRYNLKDDQVTSLRMMGASYRDITLIANVATHLGKCPTDVMGVARLFMDGQTLDQIASANNTTVASLLSVGPGTAVAGSVQEICPPPPCPPKNPCNPVETLKYYRMYPNGLPIVTAKSWKAWQNSGYSWVDVAIAANIASRTGEPVDGLLRMVRIQGRLWTDILVERGLSQCGMLDVSTWPFDTKGTSLSRQEQRQVENQQNRWPCAPGGAPGTRPCPPASPCPPSSPCPQ
ncbi:MAG: hypothetical protein NTU88_04635 [Armatimonadetes bacterium]|nr:hypothetical protein [Armatimonadota bacterium]